MKDINKSIDQQLRTLSDEAYRKFQLPLIPTVPPERVIGVRTPVLRHFARTFGKTPEASLFLQALPHSSYDANNLHAFLIEQTKDFDACITQLNQFLPYIDNWATCDLMSPKILSQNLEALLTTIDRWLASPFEYEVRFGILNLMYYYLDKSFDETILKRVADVASPAYYINMARAWFFATALAKQWNQTVTLLEHNTLDTFTHNKTIQKAIESFRISTEQKEILREMRRK